VRAILLSDAFWAPAHRATLVKSPVELVVGSLRTFAIHPFDMRPAVFACAALGQNPFAPPNVKGWPGGNAWIDSATLLGRRQWLDRLLRGSDPAPMAAMDAAQDAKQGNAQEKRYRRALERGMGDYVLDASVLPARPERLEKLVLAMPAVDTVKGLEGAELVRALAFDPTFQLK